MILTCGIDAIMMGLDAQLVYENLEHAFKLLGVHAWKCTILSS